MQVNVIGIEVERVPLEDQFHNLRIESNEIQNDLMEKFEKLIEHLRQLVIKRDKLIEEIYTLEMAKKIFELEDEERKSSMLQCNQALNDTQNQQTIQIDPEISKHENETINVKHHKDQEKQQNQSLETRNSELKVAYAVFTRLLEDGVLEKDLEKKINIQIAIGIDQKITLNDDDHQAISRLMGFGYGRLKAIMLYLTCDKVEIKAINLLNIMNLYT